MNSRTIAAGSCTLWDRLDAGPARRGIHAVAANIMSGTVHPRVVRGPCEARWPTAVHHDAIGLPDALA
jgi:hypothetical protein